MRTFILFFILFVTTSNVFSQAPLKTEIKLDDRCMLLNNFTDKNEGFVIMTGRHFGNKEQVTWNLKYYTKDLKEVWDVKIPKHYETSQTTMNLIYSPFSDFFYIIETNSIISYLDKFGISDPCYITQIDYKGNVKSIELKDFIKEDEWQIAIFLSKNYFNLVLRNENKVILSSTSHDDFSIKRKELPIIGAYEKDQKSSGSFWHFEGQTDDRIFLVKKVYDGFTDKKDNTYNYTIVSIDEEGQVKENISLNAKLTECYPVAALSVCENGPWVSSFQTLNTNTSSGSTLYQTFVHSVGNINIDVKNQSIFVYGMMNRDYVNASKAIMAQKRPDGFFIEKFDLSGNKKWKLVKDFEPGYSKNITGLPHYRLISYSDNILSVYANVAKGLNYFYKISDTGEVVEASDIDFRWTNKPIAVYYSGLTINAKENPNPAKNRIIRTISVDDRDILFDFNPEKGTLELLSFPDK